MLKFLSMRAQEVLIATEIILRSAADLALHPLAVAAAEAGKFTAGTQLGTLMRAHCKGTVFGGFVNFLQGLLRQISKDIFIHAVEITGVNTAIGFDNDLGTATAIDATGTGNTEGQKVDDVVEKFDTAVLPCPEICIPQIKYLIVDYRQFKKHTGLAIKEGFGQSESTVIIANLTGDSHKVGSMGKPVPLYNVYLLNAEGKPVDRGETGEICIDISRGLPCGLAYAYEGNAEVTAETWRDGYYHTGDLAWKDEDGFYWYVGRADDVIKSSGYRIGPFEIESTIMELPYVLECGVSAAPDEVRGQVVKASIVLVKGTEGTDALKKEIQDYVKKRTAPYKYPRIVEFKESLPKTTSGKIIRKKL